MSSLTLANDDPSAVGGTIRAALYADKLNSIAGGSVADTPVQSFLIGGADDRILGISTADQVLERWHGFLRSATKELRSKSIEWEDRRRLNLEGPPLVGRASVWQDAESMDATDKAEALGLHNSVVGRSIEALAGTMDEMRQCIVEAEDIFRPLALFGEGCEIDSKIPLLAEFSEFLPVLGTAQHILKRVDVLAVTMIRQLVGFMNYSASGRDAKGSLLPLRPLLDALSELLLVPTTIDGLLLENQKLKRSFADYTFIVRKASDPDGGFSSAQLPVEVGAQLAEYLGGVECLVEGRAFNFCIDHVKSELGDVFLEACDTTAFKEQLVAYFKERLKESENCTSGPNRSAATLAKAELPAASLVPWVCTLCLFSCLLRPAKTVQKLISDVVKMHKVSPIVVLYGRIAWCITDFLVAYVPSALFDDTARRDMSEVENYRERQAKRLDEANGQESFIKEIQRLQADVQHWLASLGATGRALESGQVSLALKEGHAAVVRGLTLALRVHASLEEYLVLHVRGDKPIPRSCLPYISLGFQLLKAIETAPSVPRWAEFSMLLQRHMALQVHAKLEDAYNSEPSPDSQRAALVQIALNCTYRIVGGGAPEHLDWYFDVGALCLCMSGQAKFTTSGKDANWRELRILSRWWEQLAKICDTTWSYWVRELFPNLLNDACIRGCSGVSGLPRLCSAFANPLEQLIPPSTKLGRALLKELRDCIKEAVIDPLYQKIDMDLRLHVFAVMQSRPELPKAAPSDVLSLLALRPLSLAREVLVDIRDLIEKQLSKSFYDLTALAMHDAEAYTRMRSLAQERYGLSILESHLPSGSLDNGLDVIEVMRSIHLFAAQYSYSLHQQWFAQCANQGDAKLNVLTVEHMTNSIKIHGMGIINTSVNYTFTYMKRKLETVVEFLSDESVKSLLLADARWVAEQKAHKSTYTWNRAMETLKFIRRLGSMSDGTSYLDKMRQVVTQIGNALGYVRMLRSAGMRCVGRSLPYVEIGALERPDPSAGLPKQSQEGNHGDDDADVEEDPDKDGTDNLNLKALFAKAAKDAQSPQLVVEASEIADEAIRNVRQSFEQSTDYLNLLAQVFGEVLRGERESAEGAKSPTSLFHLLVPALSISYLYSILVGRDALAKRAVASATTLKSNAMCFDDGFAVGVAYVLSIFGLEHDFQTLHWFDAQVVAEDAAMAPSVHQVTPEAGSVDLNSATARRREMLQRELGRLSSALEAASSLFDHSASNDTTASNDTA